MLFDAGTVFVGLIGAMAATATSADVVKRLLDFRKPKTAKGDPDEIAERVRSEQQPWQKSFRRRR
jgi:hypothetical protein